MSNEDSEKPSNSSGDKPSNESTDKSKSLAGPITTTAFINKGGGKTFAPKKVIRRRPGAAAAPAHKPSSPAISITAPQPTPEPTSDNVDGISVPEAAPVTQLPTPAATQQNVSQQQQPAETSVAVPATTAHQSAIPIDSTLNSASSLPPETDAPPANSSPNIPSAPARESDTARAAPTPKLRSLSVPDAGESQVDNAVASSTTSALESRVGIVPTEIPLTATPSAPEPAENTERFGPAGEQPTSAPLTEPAPAEQNASATEVVPPVESGPVEETGFAADITPAAPATNATSTSTAEGTPKDPAPPVVENINEISAQIETEGGVQVAQAHAKQPDVASTRPKRRKLPWTAVNAPQGDDEAGPSTVPSQPKPRRRRKAITLQEMDEEDEQNSAEEESRKRPKRASAKAWGKRKAPEPAEDDDEQEPAPPKKARKPRKDKGRKRAAPAGDADEADETVEGEASRPKKQRKRKTTAQAEGQTEGVEAEQPPKRKGRPPREPTPSDAEDEVIDPSATLMNSLASRNIRVGKLSEREKKMRTINWEEVKQRRREREMAQNAQQAKEELERRREALEEAVTPEPDGNGPQYQLIGGQLVLAPVARTDDRQARAQREMDNMEVIDEDELTNPINHKSFLRNNKRFPNEFMLPGQGKRWSAEDTARFWRAIETCGTDFGMIAKMFPGVSRASIKNKFTREERLHEQFLKQKLHGPGNSDWEYFLEQANRDDSDFADVDRIKREMAEQEAEFERQLAEARAEHEEEMRQRRLAGLEDDNEGEQDNARGKKKGKGKEKAADKTPAFVLHDDEEIIGSISDDENWGV